MTSGFIAWLTELMVMLLKGEGRPSKGGICWERKVEGDAMEKTVVNFYSSLASASLDVLNIHSNAFETL